jgi:hypothetical protein
MIGPVDSTRDGPFHPEICRHQLLLLKSLHCGRPVLYQGQRQFISCVTANLSGCDIDMIVYLAGKKGGVDSREVEITPDEQIGVNEESKDGGADVDRSTS